MKSSPRQHRLRVLVPQHGPPEMRQREAEPGNGIASLNEVQERRLPRNDTEEQIILARTAVKSVPRPDHRSPPNAHFRRKTRTKPQLLTQASSKRRFNFFDERACRRYGLLIHTELGILVLVIDELLEVGEESFYRHLELGRLSSNFLRLFRQITYRLKSLLDLILHLLPLLVSRHLLLAILISLHVVLVIIVLTFVDQFFASGGGSRQGVLRFRPLGE